MKKKKTSETNISWGWVALGGFLLGFVFGWNIAIAVIIGMAIGWELHEHENKT